MKGRTVPTQAGLVTLVMTSSPLLLLLLLPPGSMHVRASRRLPTEAQCNFPQFLQTKPDKQWMVKQSKTLTNIDVLGGKILARSSTCSRDDEYSSRRRHPDVAGECRTSSYTRLCLEQRPGNKYLARHVEADFTDKFVCLEFIQRSVSVVQVKTSMIQGETSVNRLCDDSYMHVDPWPWVSEEHYGSPPVPCPVTGGYDLSLKYSVPASGYVPSSYRSDDGFEGCRDNSTAPIRMESDCVAREGVVFTFKHERCLPPGTHLAVRQRALCMATWSSGRERFAMLRADNNDRAFFCFRLLLAQRDGVGGGGGGGGGGGSGGGGNSAASMIIDSEKEVEIEEVALFLAGACLVSSYTDTTRGRPSVAQQGTPHMAFSVLGRRVVSEPCSDELATCRNHTAFCRRLHCMKTCGMCRPGHQVQAQHPQKSFERKCSFPSSIRGTWLQRAPDGSDAKLVIEKHALVHPELGRLECVTFTDPSSEATPQRRVLWSGYANGCYPRFTCLHFNTLAEGVMRYRLAKVQLWPLQLDDDSICRDAHFMEPPDMHQPGNKYAAQRSWEVVRRSGHVHTTACSLPHCLPEVLTFRDDRGVSGCLVHGTYPAHRSVTLTFFPTRPPTT